MKKTVVKKISIIDYDGGNAMSVSHAYRSLGVPATVTKDTGKIAESDLVVLPGVGAAKATLASLEKLRLLSTVEKVIASDGNAYLGICIGMQILFDHSEEEDTDCLGIFPGRVKQFDKAKLRVPLIGWHHMQETANAPEALRFPVSDAKYFYFVNSYHAQPANKNIIAAHSTYGNDFVSMIASSNIIATQFHLEKSGPSGLLLLQKITKYLMGK